MLLVPRDVSRWPIVRAVSESDNSVALVAAPAESTESTEAAVATAGIPKFITLALRSAEYSVSNNMYRAVLLVFSLTTA